MDALKVLGIDILFKLPDDFDGDYNDALMEYINYRISKRCPSVPESKGTVDERESFDVMWRKFLEALNDGRASYGGLIFCELYEDGTWQKMIPKQNCVDDGAIQIAR